MMKYSRAPSGRHRRRVARASWRRGGVINVSRFALLMILVMRERGNVSICAQQSSVNDQCWVTRRRGMFVMKIGDGVSRALKNNLPAIMWRLNLMTMAPEGIEHPVERRDEESMKNSGVKKMKKWRKKRPSYVVINNHPVGGVEGGGVASAARGLSAS